MLVNQLWYWGFFLAGIAAGFNICLGISGAMVAGGRV